MSKIPRSGAVLGSHRVGCWWPNCAVVGNSPEDIGLLGNPHDIVESCSLHKMRDRVMKAPLIMRVVRAGEMMTPGMFSFFKIGKLQGTTGPEDAVNLAKCRRFQIGLDMMKHERG